MFPSKNKNKIEELILSILKNGPIKITKLVTKLSQLRPGTTKQGVYSAIRGLKTNEVAVTEKGYLSLNVAWLKRLSSFSAIAEHNYLQAFEHTGSFLHLSDGEKITYSFKTSLLTDVFWNHALLQMVAIVQKDEPFIAHDPHVWFFIANSENEKQLQDVCVASGRQYLVSADYCTPLDRKIKKYFDNDMSQYHMYQKPLFPQPDYYLNILGDFLIEVWLSKETASFIDAFYETHTNDTKASREALRQIVLRNRKTKLIISKNGKKAQRLKKKLLKPFWVKRR